MGPRCHFVILYIPLGWSSICTGRPRWQDSLRGWHLESSHQEEADRHPRHSSAAVPPGSWPGGLLTLIPNNPLTLTYLGGGPLWPPLSFFLTVRLYHSKFRALLSWLFPLVSPAHFDTKFTTGVPTVRLLWCNNRSTVTRKVYFGTYLNVSI